MGFVMDAISDRHRQGGLPTEEQFRADLEPLNDVCRWTDGRWYNATITAMAEDGLTISLLYDDGDTQITQTGRCRSE